MKLSEYLYEQFSANATKMMLTGEAYEPLSADSIENWIIEWYNESFKEIGCDGTIPKPRMPPMWLADWRKHIGTD